MKAGLGGLASALFLIGCGEDPPPITQLSLAAAYDVSGVARVFPNGLDVASQHAFSFVLSGIQSSGGRVVGTAEGAGTRSSLSGTFDAGNGELVFDPSDGALTSTASERVIAIGGRAEDLLPKDGVAQEITGFVNGQAGNQINEGRIVAVARYDGRPPAPVATMITSAAEGLGKLRIRGAAGSISANAGVEVLRHTLDKAGPTQSGFQARDDGSFDFVLDAFRGDILLLRGRAAGRASTAITLLVP